MWHLKKFANNAAYKEYMSSDDIWLPRVAYILNNHTESIDSSGWDTNRGASDWSNVADSSTGLPLGGDNKRWVDIIQMGKHFIEMANNGVMYFKDIQDVSLYEQLIANGSTAEDASAASWYRAAFVDGSLNITVPDGQYTFDGSILNFQNYPQDYTAFGN